jgi:hypothetical protein
MNHLLVNKFSHCCVMQGLASDDWILLFRSGQKQFLTKWQYGRNKCLSKSVVNTRYSNFDLGQKQFQSMESCGRTLVFTNKGNKYQVFQL